MSRRATPMVVVGWRAMAFEPYIDGDGKEQRRPVPKSRIFHAKDAAVEFVGELRRAGADEPYLQTVERKERKERKELEVDDDGAKA
jgi:hypothetical protein